MDSAAFDEYLEKRYYDQLDYYEKSSGINQKKYRKFQWTLIILSALTPILAALTSAFDEYGSAINLVVIIVSAVVAILTTGLKTFQFQELWANYRSTCEQLKPEIHYYNFNIGPYGKAVDKKALFVSRVETILDKEHQGWPPAKKNRDDRREGEKENSGAGNADTTKPRGDREVE